MMLAPPFSEIRQIFGTPLGFTLQSHVQILPIDPYFSFDILENIDINKHLTKYFKKKNYSFPVLSYTENGRLSIHFL